MRVISIALTGSAIISLMVVFATRNDVSQTVGTTVSAREFDQDWLDAMKVFALQQAEIIKANSTAPRVIQIERVEAKPVPDTPISAPLVNKPPAHDERRVNEDVCERHRMHKVWYGKIWRCRKHT